MRSPRSITNLVIAGALALGVAGIGITSYYQVSADTVLPGFSTAKIHLEITVPQSQSVVVSATFTPQTGKKYYFKSREFTFNQPGLNTVDWYIRKIPGGTYNFTLESGSGTFLPSQALVVLEQDKVNEVPTASLNLGEPPAPTPTPTIIPEETLTAEPTVSNTDFTSPTTTDTNTTGSESTTTIPTPPVPGQPSSDSTLTNPFT